jgi:hypothetical protein
LLKYDYSNFSLEILKYTKPSTRLKWEQRYLDKLKPKYNIFKKAGSPEGHTLSEETKQKIGAASKKILLEKGFIPGFNEGIQIKVVNVLTGVETIYTYLREATKELKIDRKTFHKYATNKKTYKNLQFSYLKEKMDK